MSNPNLYDQSDMEDWRFRQWHVGLDEGGKNTDPITSESTLIAAGPARLSQVADDFVGNLFPIGVVENFQLNQQKMLQRIREIGSRRAYIIGSHATGNVSMSRVMYSQASLLRAMTMANNDWQDINNPPGANYSEQAYSGDAAQETSDPVFFGNLQSELFDRPVGLLVYMLDQRDNPYAAQYLEDVMIQNHSFAMASQGVGISERTQMMFDRAKPVAVSTV